MLKGFGINIAVNLFYKKYYLSNHSNTMVKKLYWPVVASLNTVVIYHSILPI